MLLQHITAYCIHLTPTDYTIDIHNVITTYHCILLQIKQWDTVISLSILYVKSVGITCYKNLPSSSIIKICDKTGVALPVYICFMCITQRTHSNIHHTGFGIGHTVGFLWKRNWIWNINMCILYTTVNYPIHGHLRNIQRYNSIIRWCNSIIRLYNSSRWYNSIIRWYNSIIGWYNSSRWYNSVIRWYNWIIGWYNSILGWHNSIIRWYNSIIVWHNSIIKWYNAIIRRYN
jgi:hypothetical protein